MLPFKTVNLGTDMLLAYKYTRNHKPPFAPSPMLPPTGQTSLTGKLPLNVMGPASGLRLVSGHISCDLGQVLGPSSLLSHIKDYPTLPTLHC